MKATWNQIAVMFEFSQIGTGKFIVSSVNPHLSYLAARWQVGCYNKRQLWLEIQAQGYTGSLSSVYRALKYFAQPEGSESAAVKIIHSPKLAPPARPLSARRACWLLLHEQEKLKAEDLEVRKIFGLHA
jgi:hypothetical protein